MMTFTGHEDYDSLKPYIAITDKTRKNLMTRFRGAALAASLAARGGPCDLATAHDLAVVRAVLVYVVHERARVRRIPKQPGAKALGCRRLRRGRES